MKTLFLLLGLLLLLPAGGTGSNRSNTSNMSLSVPCWPDDTVVHVYFVRGLFSAVEKQTLQDAMASWARKPSNRDAGISFLFAGETGGLIDCVHCLTIARRGITTDRRKLRAAINPLRESNEGQLISAWVAFERIVSDPIELRDQMLELLEKGFLIARSAQKVAGLEVRRTVIK